VGVSVESGMLPEDLVDTGANRRIDFIRQVFFGSFPFLMNKSTTAII
jgi:hypothetical protein